MIPKSPQNLYDAALQAGTLQPDAAQRAAVQTLDALYRALTTRARPGFLQRLFKRHVSPPQGVYLYGPVGRGKSMLMQFLIDALTPSAIRSERHHFHEFMLGLHRQLYLLSAQASETGSDHVGQLADALADRVDVLCFDELVVTDVVDAMLLMPFFTRLVERGVTLVTTSNFAPDDLYKNGLQRGRFLPFIALLKQHLQIVYLGGPQDFRLLRWQQAAQQSDHWLWPLNGETQAALKESFAALAGYDTVQDNAIVIIPEQARSVSVFKATAHVAWLKLDVLLSGAVGAADFLALAARFQIMLLDQLTPFGLNDNDRAKRFMLLIDTLYEAGTQIYARSETLPEQLYPAEGRLAFEFTRTVSRLQEMRFKTIGILMYSQKVQSRL